MTFTTTAEYFPTGQEKHGRPLYTVTNEFSYTYKGKLVPIRPGFLTDLASIPTIFWLLHPNDPRWDDAAIIHDKACKMSRQGAFSMKFADEILYHAMLDLGSGWFFAFWFWFWVRANHILEGE